MHLVLATLLQVGGVISSLGFWRRGHETKFRPLIFVFTYFVDPLKICAAKVIGKKSIIGPMSLWAFVFIRPITIYVLGMPNG